MGELHIPKALQDRLAANPRRPFDPAPLSRDERELVALRLEWLAGQVRERPVAHASWEMHHDPAGQSSGPGAWRYTVDIQFESPEDAY